MEQRNVWLGMATLIVADKNPKRAEGFIGAFAGFAAGGESIFDAVKALHQEFGEAGYILVGLEHMLPVHMIDRKLTAYETELVEATARYPVQFKNVNLHKGDG